VPTIRDYVVANLGETYGKLTDTAGYDNQAKPDAVGLKIDAILSRFSVTESSLSTFAKSYLGLWATYELIPLAIDYYMVNTRRVDNASRPSGVTPLGGEVGQNYDRVATLERLAARLAAQLAADLPAFVSELPAAASLLSYGMQTERHTRSLRTQDPFDSFDKVAGTRHTEPVGSVGFGVGYVVVEDAV